MPPSCSVISMASISSVTMGYSWPSMRTVGAAAYTASGLRGCSAIVLIRSQACLPACDAIQLEGELIARDILLPAATSLPAGLCRRLPARGFGFHGRFHLIDY